MRTDQDVTYQVVALLHTQVLPVEVQEGMRR